MNKYLFILGLVGTALFTACSTADELTAEKPIETPPDDRGSVTTLIAEESQNSEVPITLGVSQGRGLTRKPLDPSDANGNFETSDGKYLGVFCLATGTQSGVDNIPSAISDNKWNTADDEEGLIVRLKNVPAKVTTDGTTSSVQFWDTTNEQEQHYYYPMSNWMKYNFYAYYPRQNETVTVSGQEKTTLAFMANQVLEKYYEIDGTQDIIWGMSDQENATSVAESGADPYCAKYFRLARARVAEEGGDISAYYPEFTFEHKLVQFRFFVKAADATALTGLQALNAQVTDMYIANAIYQLSLVVANKSTPSKNGELSMLGDFKTTTLRIKTNGADTDRFDQDGDDTVDNPLDIDVSKVDVTSYPATVFTAETAAAYNASLDYAVSEGDAVPGDFETKVGYPAGGSELTAAEANAYNATLPGAVAAGDENGFVGYILLPRPGVSNDDDFRYQLALKLEYTGGSNLVTINLEPPAGGFVEGKIYNIIINVQSPEEIFAKAVLQGWQTYEDDAHNPYIVYDAD
jgi:hypothetical protein